MVQFTAPIQPGNSGGPLLDSSGSVIGMVTSKLSPFWSAANIGDIPQNVNFAIRSSVLRSFLDQKEIDYSTSQSQQVRDVVQVGAEAQKIAVYVHCVQSNSTAVTPTSEAGSSFSKNWKSVKSGKRKAIRIDGDHVYVEALIPEEAKAQGNSVIAELSRQGDKYVGKNHNRRACAYYDRWWAQWKNNVCEYSFDVEIDSLTNSRIEGRAQRYPAT